MSKGFIHSVKVPKLYKTCANIVCNVQEKGGSLKSLVFQARHPNVSGIYALVLNTLQKGTELNHLLRTTQILINESRLDPWLARVLITELLWGKKTLSSECKPVQTVLKYQKQLLEALEKLPDVEKSIIRTPKVKKPRYVRINTLLITVNEAISNFVEEGWTLQSSCRSYSAYLNELSNLSENMFMQDFHISELLVFPSNTNFSHHDGYKTGKLILQDKASCIPSFVLNPPPKSIVVDMCAAPGMKTTHLAAIIQNIGKIYAIEIEKRRYESLCKQVEVTKSKCVETLNQDALCLNADICSTAEYILVDPSCSGSGMVDRPKLDYDNNKSTPQRLRSLQSFQAMLLRFALCNFPCAKRVVYSTCSICREENEDVIDEALSYLNNAYTLMPMKERLNGEWNSYSSQESVCKDSCLYARSEIDLCNGFFVAVFERNFDVPLPTYRRNHIAKTKQSNETVEHTEDFDTSKSLNKKKKRRKRKRADDVEYRQEYNDKENTENTEFIIEETGNGSVEKCSIHNEINEKKQNDVSKSEKTYKADVKSENCSTKKEKKTELETPLESNMLLEKHSKKKKKKKSKTEEISETEVPIEELSRKKKKKKSKLENVIENENSTKKSKKETKSTEITEVEIAPKERIKKKKRKQELIEDVSDTDKISEERPKKRKKCKSIGGGSEIEIISESLMKKPVSDIIIE